MPMKPLSHARRSRGIERSQKRADPFYKTAGWQRLRTIVLKRDPFCVECLKEQRFTPSSHVDHIRSRRERPDLERDLANLQGLCQSCHNSKTATHDR